MVEVPYSKHPQAPASSQCTAICGTIDGFSLQANTFLIGCCHGVERRSGVRGGGNKDVPVNGLKHNEDLALVVR